MEYDVFLSHASTDKPVVEHIARELRKANLEPWLDKWYLAPGDRWQEELLSAVHRSRSFAYIVGSHSAGPWAREETGVALNRAVSGELRAFLVLLPGVETPFDAGHLGEFFSQRTWVDLRNGITPDSIEALIRAIRGVATGPSEAAVDVECPYPGLLAYTEDDEARFKGRVADIQRLVERMKGDSFVCAVGPSGSGKSSLVRAGLVPELKREAIPGSAAWRLEKMRPGASPLAQLASVVKSLGHPDPTGDLLDQLTRDQRALGLAVATCNRINGARRLVIVVDQMEELFTLAPGGPRAPWPERRAFLSLLQEACVATPESIAVVATLRSDFFPGFVSMEPFGVYLSSHLHPVQTLRGPALSEAVREPAAAVGVELEAGLVDLIVRDAGDDPGALPLVQQALVALWNRRAGRFLTHEAYTTSGGVRGALRVLAEETWADLAPGDQATARRIFVRLSVLSDDDRLSRRPVPVSDLVSPVDDRDKVDVVLDRFIANRLLTAGSATEEPAADAAATVEIAHESLLSAWPRLNAWLAEDRENAARHRQVANDARVWDEQLERGADALYRGVELASVRAWIEAAAPVLNQREIDFISAAQAQEEHDREEERAAIRQAERVRRRGLMLGLAVALLVVSVALSGVAVYQWRRADRATDEARSAQIIDRANRVQQSDLGLGLLLSAAAYDHGPSLFTQTSLLLGLTRNPAPRRTLRPSEADGAPAVLTAAAATSDHSVLVGTTRGTLLVVDVVTGETSVFATGDQAVTRLAVSAEAGVVVTGDAGGVVTIRELGTGRETGRYRMESAVSAVAVSADGATVAAQAEPQVGVAVLDRVGALRFMASPVSADYAAMALTPDGRELAVAGPGFAFTIMDTVSGGVVREVDTERAPVMALAIAANGTIAAATDEGAVDVFDAQGARVVPTLLGQDPPVLGLALSPSGTRLVAASGEGPVVLWGATADQPVVSSMTDHGGDAVVDASFLDEDVAVTVSSGATSLIAWTVGPRPALATDVARGERSILAVAVGTGGPVWTDGVDVHGIGGTGPVPVGLDDVQAASAAAGGDRVAVAGKRGVVVVTRGPTGTASPSVTRIGLEAETEGVAASALAFMGGDELAVGTASGEVLVIVGDEVDRRFPSDEHGAVTALAYSADGGRLAVGYTDGRTRVIDAASGKEEGDSFPAHELLVSSLLFAPDGSQLISGSDDRMVTLQSIDEGYSFSSPGHDDMVTSLAYDPTTGLLASGGEDDQILLWDLATGSTIGSLRAGRVDATVTAMAFDRGVLLAAMGVELVAWTVDPDTWRAMACDVAGRNLNDEEQVVLPFELTAPLCPQFPF